MVSLVNAETIETGWHVMPIGHFTGDTYPDSLQIAFALQDVETAHVRLLADAFIRIYEDMSEQLTKRYKEFGAPPGTIYRGDPDFTLQWTVETMRRVAEQLLPSWAEERRQDEARTARYREEARIKDAARRIPKSLRKAVFERDGYRCVKCNSHIDLCVDHKFPVVRGGRATIENLQTLCRSCNSRKCARVEPDEPNRMT